MAKKKVRNPHRFSTHFGVSEAALATLGAFDPILNADTRLFIDPLLLGSSAHPEIAAGHQDWVDHFTAIIQLLRASKVAGDLPWRQVERRFQSREFKGTCLGYGNGNIDGSGIGDELRDRLMNTATEIVRLGIDDPTLFPLLSLLEEDLGPDRISDWTTRIIGKRLAEFTVRALNGLNVPTSPFDISGVTYQLPVNPFVRDRKKPLPVVLVPADILRDLPIANSWQDVEDVSRHNADLRDKVSKEIGDIWSSHTLRQKAENRNIFLASRDNFELLLRLAAGVPKDPYDIKSDPEGLARWLELGLSIATQHPLPLSMRGSTKQEVVRIVETIVDHYKDLIEQNHQWKSLYDSNGKPHREPYSQRLFFAMAIGYCDTNNIAITPESNSGGGPVDFVLSRGFHAKVLVELKLSDNKQLRHGYTKQLEKYKRGERTDEAFFVILHIGKGHKQVDAVLKLEASARNDNRKHSRVVVIDATAKPSASKG